MFKDKIKHKKSADFVAVSQQRVSAVEFLTIKSERPAEIKQVKFVAPRIGSNDFGSFVIDYRTPKLIAAE